MSNELDLDQAIQDVEYFLYGFLDGWSFEEQDTCSNGMYSAIAAAIDCLQYREIYIPSNTFKLPVAFNELEEALNTIYAYCDFTHVLDVVASLIDFSSATQWVQLAGRMAGAAIYDIPIIIDTITVAIEDDDWYGVGEGAGKSVQILLDAKL